MKRGKMTVFGEIKEPHRAIGKIKRLVPFGPAALLLIVIFVLTGCAGSEQPGMEGVEERISRLEEANELYKKKIERLDAIHEIQNLMGRYVWEHEVQKDPEFIETKFADNDEITWEVAHMGLYTGREGVREILKQHGPKGGNIAPGTLFIHTLTTPVIEIAEDGQTAKGVWKSPGAETMTDPETGKPMGMWAWTKYACDFIKEDGKWKILHYHVYRIFMTPADMNYTDEYERNVMKTIGGTPEGGVTEGDRGGTPQASSLRQPTTYDNPFTTTYVPELVPAPPEPYRTFSDTFSY